jgi:hypothetical protein
MAKEHKIRINGDQAQKEIKGLTDQIKKLKKVIEVSNQGSAKQKRAMRKLSSAVKQAKKDIQQYGSEVNKTTKLNGEYRLSTKGIQREVGILRNKLLLVSFAFGLVAKTVQKLTRLHGEQEEAERLLASRLGHVNLSLLEQASAIQKVTIHGDEANIRLMTLGANLGIMEHKLGDATKAAIGLSTAYGLDLNMSMRAVAMAQKGNTDMLARYIPALRTTKDATEKLSIVNQAAAEGWKQAKEQAQGYSGQMSQMSSRISDMGETIGKEIAPMIMATLPGLEKMALFYIEAGKGLQFLLLKEAVQIKIQKHVSEQTKHHLATRKKLTAEILNNVDKFKAYRNELATQLASIDNYTNTVAGSEVATRGLREEIVKWLIEVDKLSPVNNDLSANTAELTDEQKRQLEIKTKLLRAFVSETKALIVQKMELLGLTDLKRLELKYGKEWVDKHPQLVDSYLNEKQALEDLKKAKEDANTASERANQLLDDQIERLELAAMKTAGMRIETNPLKEQIELAGALSSALQTAFDPNLGAGEAFKGFVIQLMSAMQGVILASEVVNDALTFAFIPGLGKAGLVAALIGLEAAKAGVRELKFAQGGIVPGQGTGDTVPAMLTPGEVILNKAQQENLVGGMGGGITINIQGGIIQEDYIRNELIPAINKATSLGARINA